MFHRLGRATCERSWPSAHRAVSRESQDMGPFGRGALAAWRKWDEMRDASAGPRARDQKLLGSSGSTPWRRSRKRQTGGEPAQRTRSCGGSRCSERRPAKSSVGIENSREYTMPGALLPSPALGSPGRGRIAAMHPTSADCRGQRVPDRSGEERDNME